MIPQSRFRNKKNYSEKNHFIRLYIKSVIILSLIFIFGGLLANANQLPQSTAGVLTLKTIGNFNWQIVGCTDKSLVLQNNNELILIYDENIIVKAEAKNVNLLKISDPKQPKIKPVGLTTLGEIAWDAGNGNVYVVNVHTCKLSLYLGLVKPVR
jgi:hypothetical protein